MKNSKQIAIALGLIVFAVCGYFAYTLFSKNVPNLDDSGGFGQEIEESEIQPKLKESLLVINDRAQWTSAKTGYFKQSFFESTPLYQVNGEIVDVLKSNAVYAEVPNVWFFDNGLDIAENGILRQDPDEDEYDNLDEFMQGTDPNDGTSRPDLAMKLEVTDVIEKKWLLQVAAELNGECKFKFKSDDVPEEIKTKNYVGTGGYIFEEVLGQRFIYKEVREVEVEKFGSIRKENVYVVFDAKRGSELVLPRRIKTNDLSGYERKDQFATFVLNWKEFKGQSFQLPLGQSFSLPHNDDKAGDYVFSSIRFDQSVFNIIITKGEEAFEKNFSF